MIIHIYQPAHGYIETCFIGGGKLIKTCQHLYISVGDSNVELTFIK